MRVVALVAVSSLLLTALGSCDDGAETATTTVATTGSGGTLDSAPNSGAEPPHGAEPPVGVGGMGAMPGSQTLGGSNTGGRPLHSVSSDGKIR